MLDKVRPQLNSKDIYRRVGISGLLEKICQNLELTTSQFERAKTSYETVGDWIASSDNRLLQSTEVYLQGSGALGTSVKPIGRDEFDVDLISFVANIHKDEITSKQLKMLIGSRLAEHQTYSKILVEKKRCWRLEYKGDFHLDISPTIKNPTCPSTGELVPDRKLSAWHSTNPRGYKKLFETRAKLSPEFFTKYIEVRKQITAGVEPFPEPTWTKGYLRRIVQLLKRHRDYHFEKISADIAPLSVIVTTLAMQAYEYCIRNIIFDDELDLLIKVIEKMPIFIENRNGMYLVLNETTEGENFAERWNTEPECAATFFHWHKKALNDFSSIRDAVGLDLITESLSRSFGSNVAKNVIKSETDSISEARKSMLLGVSPLSGLILKPTKNSLAVADTEFYGE